MFKSFAGSADNLVVGRPDDAPSTDERSQPESCVSCLLETVEAESNLPSFDDRTFDAGDWNSWATELRDLVELLIDAPVRVLILGASDGRYVQMMVGHGHFAMEVSTSTTTSDRGVNTELIAKVLIDHRFAPPADLLGTSTGSPNWATEPDVAEAGSITEFVVRVFRDLMLVDRRDVAATSFVADRACASCQWEAA